VALPRAERTFSCQVYGAHGRHLLHLNYALASYLAELEAFLALHNHIELLWERFFGEAPRELLVVLEFFQISADFKTSLIYENTTGFPALLCIELLYLERHEIFMDVTRNQLVLALQRRDRLPRNALTLVFIVSHRSLVLAFSVAAASS